MAEKETKFFNREAGGAISANISRISYYPETKTFEVKFKNSQIYQYDNVPSKIWDEALKAPSIGRFMAQQIKGLYPYRRI